MVDLSTEARAPVNKPIDPLFACEGIHLTLGGREILSDINLHVARGEVLGIIGPNGAGKTSLFEVLSGRIAPRSGKVMFRGKDVTSLPYSKVQAFSVETASTFDEDAELDLCLLGLGRVNFEFKGKADVAALARVIGQFAV